LSFQRLAPGTTSNTLLRAEPGSMMGSACRLATWSALW
jgi:hypothetical protein